MNSEKTNRIFQLNSLKTKLLWMILSVVVISNVALGLTSLLFSRKQVSTSVNENLSNIARNISTEIYNVNETQFNMLDALATLPLIKSSETSLETKNEIITSIAKRNLTTFKNVSYYDFNGDTYTLDGKMQNFSNADFFKKALNGEKIVSDPIYDAAAGETLMYYAIPVYNIHHVAEGVLGAIVFGDRLSQIVSIMQFGKESHPIVINMKTGKIIGSFGNDGDNREVFEAKNNDKLSEIVADVRNGKSGAAVFNDESTGEKMTCAFNPVGGNCDWAVFCPAPYSDYFGGLEILKIIIISIIIAAIIISAVICFVFLSVSLKPLKKVDESIQEIATGNADLTKRIDIESNDEIGSVVSGFNTFTSKLQNIVSNIKDSKETLTDSGSKLDETIVDTETSIADIIENIQSIHMQIMLQGNSVTATSTAVNEISANITSLENMIQNQTESVSQASKSVEKMIENIDSVNTVVDKMAESFELLQSNAQNGAKKQNYVNEQILAIEEQSKMLQVANKTIASIAGETQLLAMNAAIEAAHAGEAGKGFSVVADEIRKLSETSSVQSKTIGQQLNEIRNAIQQVVASSHESSAAFSTVSEEIEETGHLVHNIKVSMDEQNSDSKNITENLKFMNESTSEVRASSKEMSEGNNAILSEVENLQETTLSMQQSMDKMTESAMQINKNGTSLEQFAIDMKESIKEIGQQIDQFSV